MYALQHRIDKLFEEGSGYTTDDRLREVGLHDDARRRRVRNGVWVREHPGVIRLASTPSTQVGRIRAACLVGPDIVSSHRSAALLWGLVGLDVADADSAVDVTILGGGRRRIEGVHVHRQLDPFVFQLSPCDRIPVTPPARTIIDLGAVWPWWLVERAADVAIGKRLLSPRDLAATLDRFARRGRDGTSALRELLDRRGIGEPDHPSVLESEFHRLVVEHELPVPVYEHEVFVGGRVVRLDGAYPPIRLGLEVNGWRAHSARHDVERNVGKIADLQDGGWEILEILPSEVTHRPGQVAQRIRRAIARRTPTPTPPSKLGQNPANSARI